MTRPQRVPGCERLFYIPGYPEHQLKVLAPGPMLAEVLKEAHKALDRAYPGDPIVQYRGQDVPLPWFDIPELADEAIKCLEVADPAGEQVAMTFWEGAAKVDESRTILWVLDYVSQAAADFSKATLTHLKSLQRIAEKYDENLR